MSGTLDLLLERVGVGIGKTAHEHEAYIVADVRHVVECTHDQRLRLARFDGPQHQDDGLIGTVSFVEAELVAVMR